MAHGYQAARRLSVRMTNALPGPQRPGRFRPMPQSITLRPLEPTDRPAWDRLWAGYLTFYKATIPATVSDETFARLLDPAEPMWATLALRDDEALGLVHYIRHRSTWTTGDYVYLQDLFVTDTARGTGLGRRLIEHVYAQAEAMGASRVHWLTHETNATAMQLYDRIADRSGFVQYRRVF